jgi:hypothetical protein
MLLILPGLFVCVTVTTALVTVTTALVTVTMRVLVIAITATAD